MGLEGPWGGSGEGGVRSGREEGWAVCSLTNPGPVKSPTEVGIGPLPEWGGEGCLLGQPCGFLE